MSRRDQHNSPRGRRWRVAPHISFTALAQATGYSQSYLHEVLTGVKPLTAGVAAKLGPALGVPEARVASLIEGWVAQAKVMGR